jgi:hypothetical protein
MNRTELLALLTQAVNSLTNAPVTPTQWTEEDRELLIENNTLLKDIHAATVSVKRTTTSTVSVVRPVQETKEIPMFTSIPQSNAPSIENLETKVKKSFWKKLGGGMKTAVVAIGAGGGAAALGATVDALKGGDINPISLATTAIGAAVAGAVGYRSKPPEDKEE